jgi:hypothetical protein
VVFYEDDRLTHYLIFYFFCSHPNNTAHFCLKDSVDELLQSVFFFGVFLVQKSGPGISLLLKKLFFGWILGIKNLGWQFSPRMLLAPGAYDHSIHYK